MEPMSTRFGEPGEPEVERREEVGVGALDGHGAPSSARLPGSCNLSAPSSSPPCSPPPRSPGAAGPGWISDDWPKALAEAKARKVPVFVDTWAPW